MFKKNIFRLSLIIALQFSAVSGVFAFVGDTRNNTEFSREPSSTSARFDSYQLSQNSRAKLRSRSDVMQEVKRTYKAEILKISLDESKQVYRVRVLMPNGKVRNLEISAQR